MGSRDTYRRTLVRACIAAGDESALAEQLGVEAKDVVNWLLGDKPVPTDVFLRAVDVVVTTHTKHIEDVRGFLEQVRHRNGR